MWSLLEQWRRGSLNHVVTHHDYYASTQRVRDDYDKPAVYAGICALSRNRRARMTDVPVSCCKNVPFGSSVSTLRRSVGQPQQQVARPNDLARAILVYRYQVDGYKCRLEIHCDSDGVFYAQRTYRHLSESQRPRLIGFVADKYLGGGDLDVMADKVVDPDGNELFVTEDVGLAIHYVGQSTATMRGLRGGEQPA